MYEMTQLRSICFLVLKCSGIGSQRDPLVYGECFTVSLNVLGGGQVL